MIAKTKSVADDRQLCNIPTRHAGALKIQHALSAAMTRAGAIGCGARQNARERATYAGSV